MLDKKRKEKGMNMQLQLPPEEGTTSSTVAPELFNQEAVF